MISVLNRPHELKAHVKGALKNGVTKEEITEILLQVAVYGGVPAGVDAFRNAKEAFAEVEGGQVMTGRTARGRHREPPAASGRRPRAPAVVARAGGSPALTVTSPEPARSRAPARLPSRSTWPTRSVRDRAPSLRPAPPGAGWTAWSRPRA